MSGHRLPGFSLLLALAIATLALSVRVVGLESQSLTMDEVAELERVGQSVSKVIYGRDGFPPLYQLLLKGWVAVLGPGAARWLSVACGMLLLLPIWRLGRLVGGAMTAWVAAFLVALAPIYVWYAQEARANALFYLLATTGVWLFSRGMLTGRRRDWMWYAVISIAGLYTHYYYALVIAGLAATVPLYEHARTRLPELVAVHAVLMVGALGWVWVLPPDLALQSGYGAPHLPLGIKSMGYTLMTYLFGFSVGPSVRDLHVSRAGNTLLEAVVWGIGAVVVCLLLIGPVLQNADLRRWAVRLGAAVLTPIVLCGVAAAALELGYRVRYVAWGAGLLLVVLAAGLVHGRRRPAQVLGAILLLALSIISLSNRLWSERYQNEDARQAAAYLLSGVPRGSSAFVTSRYMAGPVNYYLGGRRRVEGLPNTRRGTSPSPGVEFIRTAVRPGEKFWLLYSRPWDGDPEGRLREELRARAGLRLVGNWPGIELYEGIGW